MSQDIREYFSPIKHRSRIGTVALTLIRNRRLWTPCLVVGLFLIVSTSRGEDDERNWLQFRGNLGDGISNTEKTPVAWDQDSIDWKVEIPGRCVGGVIVIGDRVITTSSDSSTEGGPRDRLHIFCLDAESGEVRWQRQLWATGRTVCHPLTSMSAPTPASDGESIFALFASNDLVSLDLDGNVRWVRALGVEDRYAFDDRGLASSPFVMGDRLILQVECQGDSFAAGINTATGKTEWRIPLAKTTVWSSPTAVEYKGQRHALIQSAERVMVLEPESGKVAWQYDTPSRQIPSPVSAGGRIFVAGRGMVALDPEQGSETGEPTWSENRLAPSQASPIVLDGRLYVLRSPNVLVCGDANEGKVLWRRRLEGEGFWATPVAAGGYLYLPNAAGKVFVVDPASDDGEILAENDMDEEMLGSPAAAGGALYFRGVGHVYRVSGDD